MPGTSIALVAPSAFEGPGPGFADPGPPDGFVAFFVLALLLGIGGTVWKVAESRRMAREAGLDEDRAARMALFTDDGFEATYLASSLRRPPSDEPTSPPAATEPPRTTAERLRELDALRAEGLITDAEHADRRRALLDGI